MKSQIFIDKTIYELPFGFVILPEKEKLYARQNMHVSCKGMHCYLNSLQIITNLFYFYFPINMGKCPGKRLR